ncbi:MAG: DnaA/Hda family protein [Dehalococcoidia bacterium]|nr:DnaA/Hda family protein [Dehalococcoidia bacterium]
MPSALELARMWQAVLGRLEFEVQPQAFSTFLKPTRALHFEGDTLVVQAARAFDVDTLNLRLLIVVQRAVFDVTGVEHPVQFVPPAAIEANDRPLPGHPAQSQIVIGALNANYTFDRYIRAEGNRLAHECCEALLGEIHLAISPVVVFGSPGMGKTHLLHAAAAAAAARGWETACLSAEEFTTRYLSAIRRNQVERFHDEIRSVRLLIVDDLQYLAKKPGTIDELVHTIDAVANAGGAVAMGSEKHPYELDLPERLVSRLSAGVIAQVEPFRLEERRDFVNWLARDRRTALPSWAVDRIANVEVPSVRALQGAVHAAFALDRAGLLDLRRLDAELTRIAIAEAAPAVCGDRLLVEKIARYYETSLDDLLGRSRKTLVAEARAVAVAALRDRGRSLPEIAELFDGRNKSTLSPLVERGRLLLARDPDLRQRLAG